MKQLRSIAARRGWQIAFASALVSTLALVRTAQAAPVDGPSAACRAAIAKGVSRLANTTMKAFDGCVSAALKGESVDCSDHITADLQGKIPLAQAKLADAITNSCNDTSAAVALAEFQRCGAPVGTHLSTFPALANCLNSMVPENIDALRAYMLHSDYAVADAAEAKCIKGIAKNSTKLVKTMQKAKHKAMKGFDSAGEDSQFIDPGDPDGKIGDAVGKALQGLYSACELLTVSQWETVDTCDHDPVSTAICVIQDVAQLADGLVAASYDLPGVCPAYVDVLFLEGSGSGIQKRATDLDTGWTGKGHQTDSGDYFTLGLGVDCGSADDNSCSSCTLSANCDDGNCRCRNDNSILCDEPFGADTDCGGNTCDYYFGPPLPMQADFGPLCLLQRFDSLSGSASFGSGATTVSGELHRLVHFSGTFDAPCPTCVNDICVGGERNGLACVSDALSDFGEVSYDCPPSTGTNVTNQGLTSDVNLSTLSSSLSASLPCDAPLASSSCPCSACTGDNTVACDSDADCAAVGAGTCATVPLPNTRPRQPNECSDLMCSAVPGQPEEGQCLADNEKFCDGIVRGNGDGVVACSVQSDCDAVSGAGMCNQTRHRRCFLDPIVASAEGGPQIGVDEGVLASAFCAPVAANTSLNHELGLPGPTRTKFAVEFYSVCANGFTLWSPGGAVCQ